MKNAYMKELGGFTLIELLVVVLIIGILAAVAVPQYEKAVWKSRAANMKVMLKGLVDAQEVYRLANGSYATDLQDLDLGFPENGELEASISNDNYSLTFSNVLFRSGPYAGSGFTYVHMSRALGVQNCIVCVENTFKTGDFCQKFFSGTLKRNVYGKRYFLLPEEACS
ncbi:type IV pilin protein [Candidatus Avelusimicrobium aviculae]|uniref:type IV pilin protein n=1 Tax=Candidatus Avelusimicrobium aviculae TaxID=3416206 RepID=UPI003D0AF8D0